MVCGVLLWNFCVDYLPCHIIELHFQRWTGSYWSFYISNFFHLSKRKTRDLINVLVIPSLGGIRSKLHAMWHECFKFSSCFLLNDQVFTLVFNFLASVDLINCLVFWIFHFLYYKAFIFWVYIWKFIVGLSEKLVSSMF